MDSVHNARLRGFLVVIWIGCVVCCLLSAAIVTSNGIGWTPRRLNGGAKQTSPESAGDGEHDFEQQQSSQKSDHASPALENTTASSAQQGHESTDSADGVSSVWRRRVVFGSVFPDGYGNQLQGIHRLLSIAQCVPDTDIHLPPLVYDKHLPKGRDRKFTEASDIAASYYDTERIVSELGVGVVHFASECRCFDYVLSGGHDLKNEVGDASRPVPRNMIYPDRFYKNARYITPGELELARIDPNALSWKSEGCSTSNRICVFLSHHNTHAIMKAALTKGQKLNSCGYQELMSNRDRARSAVLPSKLVLNAARAALPSRMNPDRVLVVHLRMRGGEVPNGHEMCRSEPIICIGRGVPKYPYKKVEIEEFIARMKQLARENDCDDVFPIVPRKFMSERALNAVITGFGLEMHDLISSRGMHPFYTLLMERAIATQAKVYVAEVRSSMSETIQYQRHALNMSDIIDLGLNSTVRSVPIE